MKRTLALFVSLFVMAFSLQAQAELSASSSIPTPDGTIGPDEYQFNTQVSGMTIGATLGTDGMVYLAIRANTAGWVALGVGGSVMNGSRLFLAYEKDSKKVFNEQMGAGHFHHDVKDKVVTRWAVKQADGETTLELVLPASVAVSNGILHLLYAYSESTSLMSRHAARGSMSLAIQ